MSAFQSGQLIERTELVGIDHADHCFIFDRKRKFIIAGKVSHADNQVFLIPYFQCNLRLIHFQFKNSHIHRNIGHYSFTVHYFHGSGSILRTTLYRNLFTGDGSRCNGSIKTFHRIVSVSYHNIHFHLFVLPDTYHRLVHYHFNQVFCALIIIIVVTTD